MKKLASILVLFAVMSFSVPNQGVVGKWKTIDDETGKAISVVEIYESGGKIYGKVVDILNPKDKNKTCVNCSGSDKNKPIIGMTVIKGLTKEGDEYTNGKILDPKHGKLYKCYITLESADKLKVRGYIGVSLIGRTQYWYRVK
ncbi:DUF2147 domain-containing protein [Flavobacterium sp. MAH-1]|uniref:DUF2147 domain-containing protein n=1 Tax=Flavobacterium agri TaxID=2743471 RepID=A0A7Y9C6M9_9FLAO|nr:DUF2147 domain-containing protein [Flavobacterium agri]NUY82246.1 DUF2147 domain-containing protein [Flavobacterium agri]NYA72270.1 DUF2147 domain-containing protein [Flavobacterium agri]